MRFFASGFFHESVSPQPHSIPLGPFRICSNIRGDIRKSRCTTGINDTGGKFATSFVCWYRWQICHRYQRYECCGFVPFFHFLDSNPDPSLHFDADPDRLFTLMRIRIKVMQICGNSSTDPSQLHFEHIYASICEPPHSSWIWTLMRIRISILLLIFMRTRRSSFSL